MLQRAAKPQFLATMGENARNFSAGEKQLKIRMKSVKNIGKITKAMKMISTTKFKKDLARLEGGKHFGIAALDMLFKSDQFLQRKMPAEVAEPRTLVVPITSDKGLCGAINSAIVREVKKMILGANRANYQIFVIGDKGAAGLARPFPDIFKSAIVRTGTPLNYPTVMSLAVILSNAAADSDKIVVLHNEFISAIAYEQRHLELMPRHRFLETLSYGKLYDQVLPDKNTSNTALYELYLTANLFVAYLQNAAAEQSSRMGAMENASKNANEMVEKLTMKYNKARQARITTELCEIIAGTSAV